MDLSERKIIASGAHYQERILPTDNTRLAATLCMFGATLHRSCPLEWVDYHKSRESFIRNLEDPRNPEFQPKPKVTFNFDSDTVPAGEIVKAFDTELEMLNDNLEAQIQDLPQEVQKNIRNAISRLIARTCHEVLLQREELVKLIKRVPHNAKFDHISNGQRIVRMGKNASPELRSRYLSKLST
jgi:hypothetical protein